MADPSKLTKTKSAVEKAGAWKPTKTKSRFPPAPTLPWKSRTNREISTFPSRRLRLLLCPKGKQRPQPNPRRRPRGRIALFHKADRSRVNKTGQVDLLTTAVHVTAVQVAHRRYRRQDRSVLYFHPPSNSQFGPVVECLSM